VLAGLVLLGWLASAAVLWWDTGAIVAAQVRKVQLQAEVTEMHLRQIDGDESKSGSGLHRIKNGGQQRFHLIKAGIHLLT